MMMGRTRKEQPLVSDNPAQFANDLNRFYARYDNTDYSNEFDVLCQTMSSSPVTLVESDVVRCFSRINPNKAHGPDGLRGRVMKVCADQLGPAFNTIQPHVLIKKLLNLEVNPDLILWIRQFLCDRPQRVRLNGSLSRDPVLSDEVIVNTGAPQGCVLSPILFSIYTNDISCNNSFLTLIKYADDMALVGRLKDELSLF